MSAKDLEDSVRSDRDFARAAGEHLMQARRRVLESGQSVLYSRDGVLYRMHADGRVEELKRIAPPVTVERGKRVRLR